MTRWVCVISTMCLVGGCSLLNGLHSAGQTARPLIIDVRTPQEYESGHIKQAINIPYDEIGQRIAEVTADKDRRIVVYCHSGRRAGIALTTLQGMGFTHVENAGGYVAFKEKLGQ